LPVVGKDAASGHLRTPDNHRHGRPVTAHRSGDCLVGIRVFCAGSSGLLLQLGESQATEAAMRPPKQEELKPNEKHFFKYLEPQRHKGNITTHCRFTKKKTRIPQVQ